MEFAIQASIAMLNSAWGDGKHLSSLLSSWDQTGLFLHATPDEARTILSVINSWLNTPDKRSDGLMLLHKIVALSSESILSENISSWIQQALKYLEKHNDEKSRCISLMILRNLVDKASQYSNLTKTIATTVIPNVVECLNDSDRDIKFQAFLCLSKCMEKYGASCGSQKVVIERHLLDVAAKGEGIELLIAAKCMALFPLVGGGGTGQQEYKTNWKQLQRRIIGSIHAVLDETFEGITELPLTGVGDERLTLSLPQLSEKRAIPRLQQLEQRLFNLCCYLKFLLNEPMDLLKGVLVEEILSVVCRGLAVTGLSLGRSPTLENQALLILLPSVHCSLLSVLDALITILGKNFLPHHHTLYRLVINTLKWTNNEKKNGSARQFGILRSAAYKSLIIWLEESQACSGVQHFMEDLLCEILTDITPQKDSITLKSSAQSNKSRKNKSRHMDISSMMTTTQPARVDSELCEAALNALTAAITSAGCFIKVDHHKTLHQFAVAQGLELFRGGDLPPLYAVSGCQVALLSLLEALVLQPNHLAPAPTSYATQVFKAGQSCNFHEVASFCKHGLRMMERLIHPMVHSLSFSLEPQREEDVILVTTVQAQVHPTAPQIRSNQIESDQTAAADTSGLNVSDEEEMEDTRSDTVAHIMTPAKLTLSSINDIIYLNSPQIGTLNVSPKHQDPEMIDISTEPEIIDLDVENQEKNINLHTSNEQVSSSNEDESNQQYDIEQEQQEVSISNKRTIEELQEDETNLETEEVASSKKLKIPDEQVEDFTSMLSDFVE